MENRQNNNSTKYSEIESIVQIQRLIRSWNKHNRHGLNTFFKGSCPEGESPVILPKEFQDILGKRIERIIKELNDKVFQEVVHITTLDNLKNIVEQGYLKGNHSLVMEKQSFDRNSFGPRDAELEDKQSICFSPGHVDYNAYIGKNNTIKSNVCAVVSTINSFNLEKYNQFFKLVDFITNSFSYKVKINELLELRVSRKMNKKEHPEDELLHIELIFARWSFNFSVKELNEAIFYGSRKEINRFCLTRLFAFMEKNLELKNTSATQKKKMAFFQYLEKLDDAEIKKIMIVFVQTLTIYAEYNFNGYLEFGKLNIKEIRIYNENIKFDLSGLDKHAYQKFFDGLKKGNLLQLKSEMAISLTENERIYLATENTYGENYRKNTRLFLNGSLIEQPINHDDDDKPVHYLINDYSKIPAELFEGKNYIETRAAVFKQQSFIHPVMRCKL